MSTVSLVWITPNAEDTIAYLARVSNPDNQELQAMGLLDNPLGLIKYCARKKHWSIFEMANICMEINTERDIAAQILRHRSFSFQEFSQRYQDVSALQVGLVTPEMRLQDPKNRQNSLPLTPQMEQDYNYFEGVRYQLESSWNVYRSLLDAGIAKETARRILPLCTPTRMYVNGTVRSWIHYLQVRDEEGVQKEHRIVAQQAKEVFKEHLPTVYEACFS